MGDPLGGPIGIPLIGPVTSYSRPTDPLAPIRDMIAKMALVAARGPGAGMGGGGPDPLGGKAEPVHLIPPGVPVVLAAAQGLVPGLQAALGVDSIGSGFAQEIDSRSHQPAATQAALVAAMRQQQGPPVSPVTLPGFPGAIEVTANASPAFAARLPQRSEEAGEQFNLWDGLRDLGEKNTGAGKSETRGSGFAGGPAPTHPVTNPAFGGVVAFRWKIPDESIRDGCYYTYINYVTRSVRWYAYWGSGDDPKAEGAANKKYQRNRDIDNVGENGIDPNKPESPLVKFGDFDSTVIKIDIPNMDNALALEVAQAAWPRAPQAYKICVQVTWDLEAWLTLVCKDQIEVVNRTTATVLGFACFMTGSWQLLGSGSRVTGGNDTVDGKNLPDKDKNGFESDMRDRYAPPWGKVAWR